MKKDIPHNPDDYSHLFDPSGEPKAIDEQRPGEIAAIRGEMSTGLGSLAARNQYPDIRQNIAWVPPETGLQKELPGVHLGAKKTGDGRIVGYKDSSSTPVPEAGLFFVVTQKSYGYTGIEAKPMPGYKVASAELNPDTGEVSWLEAGEDDGMVKVVSDRGNMMSTPLDEYADSEFGNPGTQAGVVRVTGLNETPRYYALGAQFNGEADNWQVQGGIIEVTPTTPQPITGSSTELPPAER